MEYSIAPQYHEKKGKEIYVLRLSEKVDRNTFQSLSEIAKQYKGYYSSFKGVNGFVFKSEEAAENFGLKIANFSCQSSSIENKITFQSLSTHSDGKLEPTKGALELHEALRQIIQTEGESIILDSRLVNILDDLKVFITKPPIKFILRTAISEGITHKLLKLGKWNEKALKLVSKFSFSSGFIPELVNFVFESIAFGLEWFSEAEFSSMDSDITREIRTVSAEGITRNDFTTKNHILFMGQPICGKVSKFENILTKKGFTGFCNNPDYFKGPFAGIEDCYIRFIVSSFSKEIWQVRVTLSYSDDFLLNQDRYFKMKDLFSSKYGSHNSDENILSEIIIGDDREWFPFLNLSADAISPCYTIFQFDNGTITIQLAFHTVEIIYEDRQSRLLHIKKANDSAFQDI